jgi:hypothetical protein
MKPLPFDDSHAIGSQRVTPQREIEGYEAAVLYWRARVSSSLGEGASASALVEEL